MNQSPAEIRDQTHKRDATVSQFEVHFTNPAEWVADFKRDHEAIGDLIVRVATVNRRASLDEVEGRWLPGGERIAKGWMAKSVAASYLCRGQLVKLSAYCGVTLEEDSGLRDPRGLTAATALKLRDTLQRVLQPLEGMGLDVRGGGIYVAEGEWIAAPDEEIAAAPKDTCATCGEDIYHANEQWRHKKTKRAEALVATAKKGVAGRPVMQLHHLADPEIKDRKL